MMIDTRVFFFTLESSIMNPPSGAGTFFAPTFFHDRLFIEQHGEGWRPVNHVITPYEDGTALLSILANREIITGDEPPVT